MKPKNSCLFTFGPIFLQLDRLSKIWGALFWQRVHRCKKCPDIWKVTSSGRAEIENVNYASGNIFNFTSATRVHFSTLTSLFSSMDRLSKNAPQIFYTSCINKFRWNLASCIAPILKTLQSCKKQEPYGCSKYLDKIKNVKLRNILTKLRLDCN